MNQQIIRKSNQPSSFHSTVTSSQSYNSDQASTASRSTPAPILTTGSVTESGLVIGSDQHKDLWERGEIEYTGRDSMSNILAHLDTQIKK